VAVIILILGKLRCLEVRAVQIPVAMRN